MAPDIHISLTSLGFMNDLAVKTLSDTTIRRRPYTGGNRLSPFMQLENSPVASSVSVSLPVLRLHVAGRTTRPVSPKNIDGGGLPLVGRWLHLILQERLFVLNKYSQTAL